MPATHVQLGEFLKDGSAWTPAEKSIIKWQFHLHGDFKTALFEPIKRADDRNLARLALSFPDEVLGYYAWTEGDLGDRLRKAGLEI